MTGPFELVIFDCDGVLVDSERLAVRIDALVLAKMGWSLTEEEIVERFVGRSDSHMREELGKHLERELPEDWDAEFNDLYRDAFLRELEPVEGIVEALDRIAIPTCVASSGSHAKMRMTLWPYRPLRPVRGPDLQRQRGREWQACPRSVTPRGGADGGPARLLCGR